MILVLTVVIVIFTVIVNRPQEVLIGPPGDASALFPRLSIRKQEVDPFSDESITCGAT